MGKMTERVRKLLWDDTPYPTNLSHLRSIARALAVEIDKLNERMDAPAVVVMPNCGHLGKCSRPECNPPQPRPGLMPGPMEISVEMLDKATIDCADAQEILRAARREQAYWRTRVQEDTE